MIHIDRERIDERGRPIRPDAAWFAKAQAKTEEAERQAGQQEADRRTYADDRVKAALEELFYGKCAYCESDILAAFDWDVEHFRPKGRVAEREDHPGFYVGPGCQPLGSRFFSFGTSG